MGTFAQKPKATQQNISPEPVISGRADLGRSGEVNSSFNLQDGIGNQSIQRLLRAKYDSFEAVTGLTAPDRFGHDFSQIPVHTKASVKIQSKLAVNTPGDIYEQEADHVSKQVMRMPEPQQAGQEHERVRTKRIALSELGPLAVSPIVNEVLDSPGQPLDLATRAFFEPRFGYDFSRVRVHTDVQAAQSAGDVKARAYTVGQHIVFGAEEYTPGTNAGKSLIAHELVHTVQQGKEVAHRQDHALTTWIQCKPDVYPSSNESQTVTDTPHSTQGLTFDPSCNTAQQKLIDLVLKRTKEMVDRAEVRMLLLVTGVSEGTDKDYLRWFGTFNDSRARYVIRTYRLISDALVKGIEFTCDCSGTEYAHVFPWLKRRIHLCPSFWSAPYSGLNSKPGIIIHELAHEVLRGGDFRYSIGKAEKLAINFPWLAVRNADNIEYFAESL